MFGSLLSCFDSTKKKQKKKKNAFEIDYFPHVILIYGDYHLRFFFFFFLMVSCNFMIINHMFVHHVFSHINLLEL